MRIRTTRTWHRVNLLAVFAILAMVAGLVPGAVAAPPDGGSDYADLVFIYRDANGVPIYAEFTGSEDTAICVQPISGDDQPVFASAVLTPEELAELNGLAKPVTNGDGWEAWLVPMWGTAVQGGVVSLEDVEAAEVDLCDLFAGTVGDVVVNFAPELDPYVHEVPFSRLSGGRAPERVLNQQYAEVTVMLTDAEVGLDPAGRLTAGAMTYELGDGTAIDSSPMNQSIYRELLRNGVMDPKDKNGDLTGGARFVLPGDPMDIAAMAMGAAADKSTPISIDTLAARHMSVYGYERETTPRMSEFAKSAITFDACRANAPRTMASYLSQFTGLYPTSNRTPFADTTTRWLFPREENQLTPNRTSLAEALRAIGYHTAAWVDNPLLVRTPGISQGFDFYDTQAADIAHFSADAPGGSAGRGSRSRGTAMTITRSSPQRPTKHASGAMPGSVTVVTKTTSSFSSTASRSSAMTPK